MAARVVPVDYAQDQRLPDTNEERVGSFRFVEVRICLVFETQSATSVLALSSVHRTNARRINCLSVRSNEGQNHNGQNRLSLM